MSTLLCPDLARDEIIHCNYLESHAQFGVLCPPPVLIPAESWLGPDPFADGYDEAADIIDQQQQNIHERGELMDAYHERRITLDELQAAMGPLEAAWDVLEERRLELKGVEVTN